MSDSLQRGQPASPSGARAASEAVAAAPGDAVPTAWWLASAAIIVAAVVVVFGRCVNHQLTSWDDFVNWRDNPFIRGFEWSHVRGMLVDTRVGVWQPVGWLVAAAQYVTFAPRGELALSRGIHVTSIALHAVAAVMCLALMRRLLRSAGAGQPWATPRTVWLGATLAALFFAIHPLRVEIVAWASTQSYIVAMIGSLGTLICYLRAVEHRTADGRLGRGPYLAAVAFYALALLGKAVAIPIVAVLLVLDVYPLRRIGGTAGWTASRVVPVLVEKLPFAALAGTAAGIAVWATVSNKLYPDTPLLQKIEMAAYNLMLYPALTGYPVHLSPQYAEPMPFDVGAPRFALMIPLVLLVALALFLLRRRWPALVAAWIAMVLCLLPNLQFIRHGGQLAAERYTYLSCLGFAAVFGAVAARMMTATSLPRAVRGAAVAVGLGLLVLLGVQAARYSMVYRDSVSVWTAMTERNPGWWVGPYNLALAYRRERQDRAAARLWYQKALDLNPTYPEANVNMGNLVRETGDLDGALRYYEQALRGRPTFYMAHWAIGQILASRGQTATALQHYDVALQEARALGELERVAMIERDLQRVVGTR